MNDFQIGSSFLLHYNLPQLLLMNLDKTLISMSVIICSLKNRCKIALIQRSRGSEHQAFIYLFIYFGCILESPKTLIFLLPPNKNQTKFNCILWETRKKAIGWCCLKPRQPKLALSEELL